MKLGDKATLTMKKSLHTNVVSDEKSYFCSVLKYDPKQECIYLVLKSDVLPAISLDAIYQCEIQEIAHTAVCTGRIKDRFRNEFGKILKLEIENGFYKINLKSVDK